MNKAEDYFNTDQYLTRKMRINIHFRTNEQKINFINVYFKKILGQHADFGRQVLG